MANISNFWNSIDEEALVAQDRVYEKTQAKIVRAALQFKLRVWQGVAAASIALLITIGGIGFLKMDSRNQIMLESNTPIGGTTKLTLDDGTVVILNAGSSISYPMAFTGNTRVVNLKGEAYFEVAKDEKHPFIVKANDVKIRVLGTTFNIRSYANDDKIIATLLEGSVNVEMMHPESVTDNKLIVLKPDQQVIFDKSTKLLRVSRVDADLYASWKDGQCFFENEKLIDISRILGRHFGIPVTIVSPELENQRYSGLFTKKEGIIQILNSFKKMKKFDYKQTDSGIEIYSR